MAMSHLNKSGVLFGKKNLDAKNISVDAKEGEENVGRHARLLQVGNDENAAALLSLIGHAHQAHAASRTAEIHAAHAAKLVVASALIICSIKGESAKIKRINGGPIGYKWKHS